MLAGRSELTIVTGMPTPFAVLLDAPGSTTSRIPLAKLGKFKDRRYGEFSITPEEVKSWQKNLAQLPGGRALIDQDHLADKPSPHRNTEASGWITGIEMDGDMAYAQAEWTPKGASAVEEGRYLFISPTFGTYTNETGEEFKNTLTGAALTNKPFLNMPMVTLASPESIQRALDEDPAAAFYQKALDGELGEEAQKMALDADPADAEVSAALGDAFAAIQRAIDAQRRDNDEDEPEEPDEPEEQPGPNGMTLEIDDEGRVVNLDTLSTKQRNSLKDSDFALPGRRYPIHDAAHARNALARVAQNGTPEEQSKVKAAVYRRFPELKPSTKQMEEVSDSRGHMKINANILKALGVTDEDAITHIVTLADEGADEAKLLEAIEAAKPAEKTLEELAEEAGAKVLSADEHSELTAAAEEGAEAKRQLDAATAEAEPTKTLEERAAEAGLTVIEPERLTTLEAEAGKVAGLEVAVGRLQEESEERQRALDTQVFETEFEKALDAGRAVPAQKEQFEKFYALDKEGTITMLTDAPVILGTKPSGKNTPPAGENAPEGVHPERHELEGNIDAYMAEHGVSWAKALEAVAGVSIPGMGD